MRDPIPSLKLTASLPLKIGLMAPKRKGIVFQPSMASGAFAVSFRECIVHRKPKQKKAWKKLLSRFLFVPFARFLINDAWKGETPFCLKYERITKKNNQNCTNHINQTTVVDGSPIRLLPLFRVVIHALHVSSSYFCPFMYLNIAIWPPSTVGTATGIQTVLPLPRIFWASFSERPSMLLLKFCDCICLRLSIFCGCFQKFSTQWCPSTHRYIYIYI